MGELSLLLIGCSTWESRPSTSSGQHRSTAGLVKGEQVSQSLGQSKGELTLLLMCHEVAWVQDDAFPLLFITTCSSWEIGP